MKKSYSVLMVAFLFLGFLDSSHAALDPHTLFTAEFVSGGKDEGGYHKVCKIRDFQVHTTVKGFMGEKPKNVYAPLAFTSEVPTIAAAKKLIVKVASGSFKSTDTQTVDGPMTQYHGYVHGKIKALQVLLKSSGQTVDENTSPLTTPLLKFIEANCGF